MFPLGIWQRARARRPAGEPVFNQDRQHRSRETFPGGAAPGRRQHWAVAFGGIRSIAAATRFSLATVCFFCFGSPLLTVFKSLYHLATFLLKKQDSPTPPNSVATSATAKNRVAVRRYLLAFGRCDCHCSLCGRLFAYGSHQHVPPHPPEAKPPSSYHQGSGRRPEKVHCTELLHTL